MTEPRKRRRTAPWKHIYGKDRGYTARVDRLRERQREDEEDTAVLEEAAKRYAGKDWREIAKPL